MYFRYFVITPWKRVGTFISTNLNLLNQKMLSAMFGWNLPSGSGEKHFFIISSMYFRYFVIIFPWKRVGPFIWTNFNTFEFTEESFVPSLFEIGPMVLEEKIFSFSSMYFRYFCNDLPLEKEWGPSFQQTWISLTKKCFLPSLVEIGQVVLEKNIFL